MSHVSYISTHDSVHHRDQRSLTFSHHPQSDVTKRHYQQNPNLLHGHGVGIGQASPLLLLLLLLLLFLLLPAGPCPRDATASTAVCALTHGAEPRARRQPLSQRHHRPTGVTPAAHRVVHQPSCSSSVHRGLQWCKAWMSSRSDVSTLGIPSSGAAPLPYDQPRQFRCSRLGWNSDRLLMAEPLFAQPDGQPPYPGTMWPERQPRVSGMFETQTQCKPVCLPCCRSPGQASPARQWLGRATPNGSESVWAHQLRLRPDPRCPSLEAQHRERDCLPPDVLGGAVWPVAASRGAEYRKADSRAWK